MASIARWMQEVNERLAGDAEFSEDDKAMMSVQMAEVVTTAVHLGADIAARQVYENADSFGSEAAAAQLSDTKGGLDDKVQARCDELSKGLESLDNTADLYGLDHLMQYCGQTTLEGLGSQAANEFASDYIDALQAGKYVAFDNDYVSNAQFNVDVEMGAPLDIGDMWESPEIDGDEYGGYDI